MSEFVKFWRECSVGELGTSIGGLAFRPQDAKDAPGPGLIACFRTSNIQQELDTRDVLFIPESLLRNEGQLLQDGDILISTANSDNLVGKCVIVDRLKYPATLGGVITAFRVDPLMVIPRYFYYWLSSLTTQARLRALARRTTNIANLSMNDVAKIKFSLPPLSEQQRIVEILQEVEEIRRLRAEAENKSAELIPAMFFKHFEEGQEYEFKPLYKLADIVSGVAVGRKMKGMALEVPYLRVANVQAGFIDLSEIKTTMATNEEELQFGLKSGDVLLTEGGDFDKLGRGCLWEGQIETCIHQNHVFRVRPKPGKLNSHFFAHYLQSARAKHYFLRCAKKTTNLASINLTQLKALPVPNIPIKDQEKFESQIRVASEFSNMRGDATFIALTRALSANAFSGQLTADWRENYKEMLALEARDRDAALKESGAALSLRRRGTIQEMEAVFEDRTDGVYSELNREQRGLLREIGRMVGGVRYARYFSAQMLSEYLSEGPLRRNPQAIEGHLSVFAARGLIIPVSREEQTEDTGEFVFGNAYRLPLDVYEPGEDEEGAPGTGDYSRLSELERLAAQIEKERAVS